MRPKCIFKQRLQSFLCQIITCDIFSITLPENHLWKNKQLINFLYYDVKNLTSILHMSKVCDFQQRQ